MSPKLQLAGTLLEGATQAGHRAADYLARIQSEQGYWWAELTADTTLESDYVLLQLWLHPPVNGVWNPPTRALLDKELRFASIRAKHAIADKSPAVADEHTDLAKRL